MQKKFESSIYKMDSRVYFYHFIVPKDIHAFYKDKGITRFICTLNEKESYPCAMTSNGEGNFFISVNKEIRKKLNLDLGSKVQVVIEEDKSKYGMPLPAEMKEMFFQDPEGSAFFHALTPGKQRSLLYMVGKPKSEDARLKKAVVVMEHLKKWKGKLDYKILNEEMKNFEW